MLLEGQGLKKSFWIGRVETRVLQGIDIRIEEKEMIAIVGASGAGKSTLLHLLGSLDPPTEGKVLFEGKDLYAKKDRELSRLRNEAIGFVFQFHHLLPEFTALENVMMPLLIRGESKDLSREKSEGWLGRLGLSARSHHLPAELSGGEQQRVAVARAVVTSPRILFADEPTGNLDHETGEALLNLLFSLREEQKMALVLVTHNPSVATRFPKTIHLEDGRIARA